MPKSKETISDSESSSSGSVSEEEVKSKSKAKPKKPEKKKQESSASSESEDDSKSKKRQKKSSDTKPAAKKAKTNDSDEVTWELGANKRVAVRSFKNNWFVDIREMYSQGGELKPGKKGICLKPEQWRELFKIAEDINETIKSKC